MEQLLGPAIQFQGLNSAHDPAFLSPGFWQKAINVRASGHTVEARGGMLSAKAIATLPAAGVGGVYQGSIETIDGSFLAWSDSGTTKIYKWVTNAWVEVTGTTGTTTRFTGAVPITFTVVRDAMLSTSAPFNLPGQRYLVAQSGVSGDYPRVMKISLSVADSMKIHAPIGYGGVSLYHARAYYSQWFIITKEDSGRTPGTVAVTESDATHIDGSLVNSGTNQQYVSMSVKTIAASGDTVTLTFSSSTMNFSLLKEMHILFSGTYSDIWTQFLIEAYNGSSYVTIFDPLDATYATPVVVTSGQDSYLAGFKLKTIASASYSRLRFTFKGTAQSATSTVNIYGIFGSAGTIPGGTQFSVGYMDSASRAEGPAVVCADDGEVPARNFGSPVLATTNDSELKIPISPALGYEYQIFDGSYNSIGTPDYKNIYAKLPEGSEFLYLSSSSSLSSATVVTSYIPYLLPAPTGLHVPIPVASVMASIGPRLWCGNVRSPYNAASTSDVWFSSLDTPFRFKQILEFTNGVPDIKGPATVTLQGEVVQAITPIAGGAVGSEGCYIFTDQNIYQAGGSDSFQLMRPGRKAGFGTNSPNSIAVYAGLIVFMDSERQVRFLDASMTPISRDRVEDKLLAIPAAYIGNTAAGIWRDKYYLAYTPSGGTTNTELLVYDIRRGIWYSDTVATPIVRFNPFLVSGERQNLAYLSTGQQIQYDYPFTSDLGTNITITLKSRELNNGLWLPIVVKNIGAIVAKTANGTALTGMSLTCKRYTKVSGETPTAATIDLDDVSKREYGASDNLNWRWDVDSSGNTPATIPDPGASIELTGTVLSGTKIYSIVAEVEPVELGGADRL